MVTFKANKIFWIKKLKRPNCWSSEEDQILVSTLSQKKRNKWKRVLELLRNKSKNECHARYNFLNTKYTKGRWNKEEDKKLIDLVNLYGKNWKLFSKLFLHRTNKQIRTRYSEYLDERLQKSKKFSQQEDELILRIYQTIKCFCTSLYRKYFPSRSIKSLKRRLATILKLKRLAHFPFKSLKLNQLGINVDELEKLLKSEEESLASTEGAYITNLEPFVRTTGILRSSKTIEIFLIKKINK